MRVVLRVVFALMAVFALADQLDHDENLNQPMM
jgi:hypothetical protein